MFYQTEVGAKQTKGFFACRAEWFVKDNHITGKKSYHIRQSAAPCILPGWQSQPGPNRGSRPKGQRPEGEAWMLSDRT